MFCDLVNSTGIAAKLDAEEWRDLVGAYLDAASAAVTEMGGKVAKLGDGLMAIFGSPVAQENDAERAVRAALSIQRALAVEAARRRTAGSRKPMLLALRSTGGGRPDDRAGRYRADDVERQRRGRHPGGQVVAGAGPGRCVAEGSLAARELKGVPEPVALFRLVRASGGGRRSGARQLTPLVGRDEEMAMLTRRWERARQCDGQLVLIVGEPGRA